MNPRVLAMLLVSTLFATTARAAEVGLPEGGETAGHLHVTVDGTFTYGIGIYSAIGGQLHALGQETLWNTRLATGSFDFGVLVGLQDEPMALQFGGAAGQTTSTQRLNTWVTVGHTFHLGARRRSGLGLHLFGGWTQVWTSASVVNPDLGLNRQVSDAYGLWNSGAMLKYDYRFSRYVGLSLQAAVPFWGVQPSYVATIFHVGVGLTGYFR